MCVCMYVCECECECVKRGREWVGVREREGVCVSE